MGAVNAVRAVRAMLCCVERAPDGCCTAAAKQQAPGLWHWPAALLPARQQARFPAVLRLCCVPAQVRDLLSKDPTARLELRESAERGVHVRGLREFVVRSAAEMAAVLEVRRQSVARQPASAACTPPTRRRRGGS